MPTTDLRSGNSSGRSSYSSEVSPKRDRDRMIVAIACQSLGMLVPNTRDRRCRRRAKLGATLGVFLLPILKERFGVSSVLGIVSAVSVLGLIVTLRLRREDTAWPLFGIVEKNGK